MTQTIDFQTGATPLYTATEEGHFPIVELLIKHGADVNRSPKGQVARDLHIENQTPLLVACMKNHETIIRHLIEAGADVNATSERGSSPFLAICQHNNVELARLLMERGAKFDVEARNLYDGKINGLIVAAESGSFEILELLVDAGLDVNYKIEGKVCCRRFLRFLFFLLLLIQSKPDKNISSVFTLRAKLLDERHCSVLVPKASKI